MDLKSFREDKLRMSQAQFAALLGMRQDNISKLEKNPDSISIDLLVRIAKAAGCTTDEVLGYQKDIPSALEVNDTWKKSRDLKDTLLKYFQINRHSLPEAYLPSYDDFIRFVHREFKKPRVAFTGASDSGKSTMINALLGKEKMPTAWSPTTSIIVYIKHIDDRPEYINDELLVLRRDDDGSIVDDAFLYDKDKFSKYIIANGTSEMLPSFGTRTGSAYSSEEVGSAVIFLDSPVLKVCDLVDVPGITGGIESDNASANYAREDADIIVFLSQASGFLDPVDCVYLKQCLMNFSSSSRESSSLFDHLFIVASQAHHINGTNPDGVDALDAILKSGCERLLKTIPDISWEEIKEEYGDSCTEEALQGRFYTYTTDIGRLRKLFEDAFREQVEAVAAQQFDLQLEATRNFISEQMETLNAYTVQLQKTLENRDEAKKELHAMKEYEPKRGKKDREAQDKVHAFISTTKLKDKEAFRDSFIDALSDETISKIIDDKHLKNTKEDISILCSNIASIMETRMNRILKKHNEEYGKLIENYLSAYSFSRTTPDSKHSKVNVSLNSFNAQRVFASGAAGIGTFGAMSLWAASFGNLGGYILAAKGVSLLSALGISTGGTAAVMSALAAIGGPATIFAGLALVAASGAFLAAGPGWKKATAKKIRTEYYQKDILSQYYLSIDKFWDATATEFKAGVKAVNDAWDEEMEKLNNIIESTSEEEIKQQITDAQYASWFFKGIPVLG